MIIPLLLGQPLHLWLGILLFFLITFQILSGKRLIKVPFIYHRRAGWLVGVVAVIHGLMGLGIWLWGFRIGN